MHFVVSKRKKKLSSGFFTCVKCKTYGEWGALRKVLHSASMKSLTKGEISELKSPVNGIKFYPKEPTFKETLYPIDTKSKEELSRLIQQFNLPVCIILNSISFNSLLHSVIEFLLYIFSNSSCDETT